MTNSSNDNLPPIPAKRYFSLEELCELARINPAQFADWQHEHGLVIGYGGNVYTRSDVVKIRQLCATFSPFVDTFNRNGLDAAGNPAATAEEMTVGLAALLDRIEKALAWGARGRRFESFHSDQKYKRLGNLYQAFSPFLAWEGVSDGLYFRWIEFSDSFAFFYMIVLMTHCCIRCAVSYWKGFSPHKK